MLSMLEIHPVLLDETLLAIPQIVLFLCSLVFNRLCL
jgi:hypothetical protein